MPVNAPGFNGGDRTSIQLPAVQTNLLKALHQTGKPVIFVMMTGSAIAIPWEAENLPAIVNSWYGGQSAGTAIADVLFGDYNPAGRLPVTFYKSDADLPDFMSYDMRNRTYRYFKGQTLYPFGFGLSYSRFEYADIKVPAMLKADKPLPVSVWVENRGEFDGDEVVRPLKTVGMAFLALTVYAIGKTFFWPTMLAVVSDRYPQTGAVAISVMALAAAFSTRTSATPCMWSTPTSPAPSSSSIASATPCGARAADAS